MLLLKTNKYFKKKDVGISVAMETFSKTQGHSLSNFIEIDSVFFMDFCFKKHIFIMSKLWAD